MEIRRTVLVLLCFPAVPVNNTTLTSSIFLKFGGQVPGPVLLQTLFHYIELCSHLDIRGLKVKYWFHLNMVIQPPRISIGTSTLMVEGRRLSVGYVTTDSFYISRFTSNSLFCFYSLPRNSSLRLAFLSSLLYFFFHLIFMFR